MTAKQYFRLSLLLPIVVPAIAFCLRGGFNLATGRTWGDLDAPQPLVYVETYLIFSPLFGGPQYLVFALWAWFWIPRQSVKRILYVFTVSPLIVLGINFVAWCAVRIIAPETWLVGLLRVLWHPFLLVGYGYVGLVIGSYWALKNRCFLTNHLTTG